MQLFCEKDAACLALFWKTELESSKEYKNRVIRFSLECPHVNQKWKVSLAGTGANGVLGH